MSIQSKIYLYIFVLYLITIIYNCNNNSLVSALYHKHNEHRNSRSKIEFEFCEAKSGEFPWLARVYDSTNSRKHYCLGVILDEYHVLTTTKCTCGDMASHIPMENLRVVAGGNWLPTNDDNVYKIDKIFTFQMMYLMVQYHERLAIIKTKEKIIFREGVEDDEIAPIKPISLPKKDHIIEDGEILTSIQWLPFEKIINKNKILKANSMIHVDVMAESYETCGTDRVPNRHHCLAGGEYCIMKEYNNYFLDSERKFSSSLLIKRNQNDDDDDDDDELVGIYAHKKDKNCKIEEPVVIRPFADFYLKWIQSELNKSFDKPANFSECSNKIRNQ